MGASISEVPGQGNEAELILLPHPRVVSLEDGEYVLAAHRLISIDGGAVGDLINPARRLQGSLREFADVEWEIGANPPAALEGVGARLSLDARSDLNEQGYVLDVSRDGISISASTAAGVFYGVCTLAQIVQQYGRRLPALHIEDWPDFGVRGVMLDISRDKVPTMETLYDLVDMLAGWKVNQLQLYTEHTFAYRQHPDVWAEASPITGDEILALDTFCRERFIELVPNQNSFGHMKRWLIHSRYASLAEVQGEFKTPWGTMEGPFSLCPGDPGSLELVRSLFDELLPHFSSRQLNVGCDETFDLGQGRSKEECEERGTERVYLDYLLRVYDEVTKRGHTMQFWGDIIVQKPELIGELPRDAIALEWGYEGDHPFDEHGKAFAASGIPFYVCPGTSSWTTIGGRTDNALANLLNAAENGLKHGAAGYLNTDWGDLGHWQVLPVSYMGFAGGAAYSWGLDANRELDMARAVSLYAFRDATGSMGRVAYDLGNVYQAPGVLIPNSSLLFWVLNGSWEEIKARLGAETTPDYSGTLEAIGAAMEPMGRAGMMRADAALILAEFENTARLMRHACKRALFLTDGEGDKQELGDDARDIVVEYERIWLARNRPGGLADSTRALKALRRDYE